MAVSAWEGETLKSTQLAAANLSTNLFYAVQVGSGGVTLVSSQGADRVAILTNKPLQGDPCRLVDNGETKAIAGAAITLGAKLMTDTSGRLITYAAASGQVPCGVAMSPASQAGDIFTAKMIPVVAL